MIARVGATAPQMATTYGGSTAFELWVHRYKFQLWVGGSLLVGLGVGYWLGKR